jgi:hypothetical protein
MKKANWNIQMRKHNVEIWIFCVCFFFSFSSDSELYPSTMSRLFEIKIGANGLEAKFMYAKNFGNGSNYFMKAPDKSAMKASKFSTIKCELWLALKKEERKNRKAFLTREMWASFLLMTHSRKSHFKYPLYRNFKAFIRNIFITLNLRLKLSRNFENYNKLTKPQMYLMLAKVNKETTRFQIISRKAIVGENFPQRFVFSQLSNF